MTFEERNVRFSLRKLNISLTARELIDFIKIAVTNAGFSRAVINVSGGIDSATAATLAVAALGPENVLALLLPYGNWHTQASALARQLLDGLGVPAEHVIEMDITPIVDAVLQSVNLQHQHGSEQTAQRQLDTIRIGNVMARVRMITLFDHAKKFNALVVGTENKSEYYLGYYTRFGDEASDIEPLCQLYKTEIYRLAEYLNVPKAIQAAMPTAGLWQGQTDEGQFGFTYEAADEILYGLYDSQLQSQTLIEHGLDGKIVDAVETWVKKMAFKHHLPKRAPEPVFASE